MRYGASFLAYAIWVHKNATPKNWLMRVKGLNVCVVKTFFLTKFDILGHFIKLTLAHVLVTMCVFSYVIINIFIADL